MYWGVYDAEQCMCTGFERNRCFLLFAATAVKAAATAAEAVMIDFFVPGLCSAFPFRDGVESL